MTDKIDAVMESADFGPHYEGESFVLVTMRVPKDVRISPGLFSLEWKAIEKPGWSKAKDEAAYARARERANSQ